MSANCSRTSPQAGSLETYDTLTSFGVTPRFGEQQGSTLDHPTIHYIDTPTELERLCRQIEGSDWLAVDTEFLRESTYFPQFCLLQIASTDHTACIDPLAIEDLDPLFEILYNPGITKVFHSGRQDMEIFYNLRGCLPGPVFDTQIAAPLMGFNEQIGYAALVSEVLGVDLGKAHTRTDWSQRPLSQAQINYASDDVIYLGQVYLKMREQLSSLERLDWLIGDFAALLDSNLYQNPPEKAWKRIRAAQRLNGESLSILQALAHWREETAHSSNRPRNWIIKDEVLVCIARLKPSQTEDLKTLRGLHERTLKRHGEQICHRVAQARKKPPEFPDIHLKSSRKTPQQEALVQLLTGVVHQRALETSLGSATLAPKKDLEKLVEGDPDNKLMSGWRKSMIGDELLSLLQGEKRISVRNGAVKIEDNGS